MFFRSLMSAHNPDLEIYNADAAHTLPAVLVEALVHSRPGVLWLLPAAPAALARGAVRGVACRGGVTVEELTWTPDGLRARLVAAAGQRLTVRSPHGDVVLDLAAAVAVDLALP